MKIIIANWKMNPSAVLEALALYTAEKKSALQYPSVTTVICLPFPYLAIGLPWKGKSWEIKKRGAQDMFWEEAGAYTGEISPTILKDYCVEYVILGHSERRTYLGETNEMINKKVLAALRNNITPILCVGETQEEGEQGKKEEVLTKQIQISLGGIETISATDIPKKIIIAYEPHWAVGTGVSDTPENTVKTIQFLKELTKKYAPITFTFIYGGSLDDKNARDFLKEKEIEGALIGKASLDPVQFSEILRIASGIEHTTPQ